jgi:dihydrofolate reductase
MRTLRVIEFMTLDGVIQAPGSPDEDREGGFQHGGWQIPYFDDVLLADSKVGIAATDAYLFGRKTYEIMAAYWPTAPADDPYAGHLNGSAKYVASRTLRDAEWQNTTLLEGDVAEAVAKLKAGSGKDIAVLGSADLAQTLMKNDFVDEYSLMVFPLVLGSGKRLFRDAEQVRRLRLVDSQPTTTGGLILAYRPA